MYSGQDGAAAAAPLALREEETEAGARGLPAGRSLSPCGRGTDRSVISQSVILRVLVGSL